MALTAAALAACSTTTGGGGGGQRAAGAGPGAGQALSAQGQQLQRQASAESRSGRLTPRAVPPPPGVEPPVLEPRTASDLRANLTIAEALKGVQWKIADDEPAGDREPAPTVEAKQEAARRLASGRQAAAEQRYLVAITELRQATALDPANADVLRQLARCYTALPNTTAAAETYERLIKLDPKDAEAALALGLAAVTRRDFERAVAMLGPLRAGADDPRKPGGGSATGPGSDSESDPGLDPGAPYLADFALWFSLRQLGFDRASIEAGQRAAQLPELMLGRTPGADRLGSVYRQRGEIWRGIGDAWCRLGDYQAALTAYANSASLPIADPDTLHARVVYANLRLGRVSAAQLELLSAMEASLPAGGSGGKGEINERDVGLCSYLAEHAAPVDLLADAVVAMYRARPDDQALARAAATLLPPPAALALLREFVDRRPDDAAAVSQLLLWLAQRDAASAVELTIALGQEQPRRAAALAEQLTWAAADAEGLIAILARAHSAPSPALAVVEAGLLSHLEAYGQAWTVIAEALQGWPDEPVLLQVRIELAAAMQEPHLLAEAGSAADRLRDAAVWITLARAHLSLGQLEQAQDCATAATAAAAQTPDDADASIAMAEVIVAQARTEMTDVERRGRAADAASLAERALRVSPGDEKAFSVLLAISANDGPAPDTSALRQTARRLEAVSRDGPLLTRLIARDEIAQRRFEPALERLLTLYASDPSDAAALKLAVAAWRGLARPRDAERWLADRLKERPGDPVLLDQWVGLYLEDEDADAVLPALRSLTASQPHNFAALRLLESACRTGNLFDEATSLGERRLTSRPEGVRRDIELAALYAGAGRSDEAFVELRWITDHPQDAMIEHFVAALAVLQRMDESDPRRDQYTIELAQRAIDEFPNAPLQVYGAGMEALASSGPLDERFDEMARRAAVSSAAQPETPRSSVPSRQGAGVYRQLAQALVDSGHPAAAARALRVRLFCDPPLESGPFGALAMAAFAADAATGGQAAASIELLRRIKDDGRLAALGDPELAEAYHMISNIYLFVGDDAGADELLQQTVALDGDHIMGLNDLGYTRIDHNRNDPDTLRMIEHAYQLKPDDDNILDTLGWLRYKQGRFDDGPPGETGAVTLIRHALEASENRSSPEPEVLEHLGDSLWRAGKKDEAIQTWERAAAMLDGREHRERSEQAMLYIQLQSWSLVVVKPADRYDHTFGRIAERLRVKLAAARRGGQPAVAPTFAESQADQ